VDKIVCVGKNYSEHAKELGDAVPDKPVVFLKPPSVLKQSNGERLALQFPSGVGSVHHECEIVLKLASAEKIEAVSLGLDLTLRDRQALQKKAGHPWTTSKVFRDSAVVGPWVPVTDFPKYLETEFTFSLDGQVRQRGKGTQMTFLPEQILSFVDELFPLMAGDLIYTGTPVGVGPIVVGQVGKLVWGPITYEVAWE